MISKDTINLYKNSIPTLEFDNDSLNDGKIDLSKNSFYSTVVLSHIEQDILNFIDKSQDDLPPIQYTKLWGGDKDIRIRSLYSSVMKVRANISDEYIESKLHCFNGINFGEEDTNQATLSIEFEITFNVSQLPTSAKVIIQRLVENDYKLCKYINGAKCTARIKYYDEFISYPEEYNELQNAITLMLPMIKKYLPDYQLEAHETPTPLEYKHKVHSCSDKGILLKFKRKSTFEENALFITIYNGSYYWLDIHDKEKISDNSMGGYSLPVFSAFYFDDIKEVETPTFCPKAILSRIPGQIIKGDLFTKILDEVESITDSHTIDEKKETTFTTSYIEDFQDVEFDEQSAKVPTNLNITPSLSSDDFENIDDLEF